MTVRQLQDEIIKLKKQTDTCILAHSYMSEEICEIADFTGDSYALAVKAKATTNKNVIMCGVRFMAEMVKMLNPEKKVILSNPAAGCPMAEQMDKEMILQVKEQYPDYAVVAYVNTTLCKGTRTRKELQAAFGRLPHACEDQRKRGACGKVGSPERTLPRSPRVPPRSGKARRLCRFNYGHNGLCC